MPNNADDKITQLNQKYEDSLFRLVMNDLAEREGKHLLEENIKLRNTSELSSEKTKRFTKLLNSQLGKVNKSRKSHHSHRLFYKFSIAMLIMICTFTTMMITVQAFRIQVLNLLISIEPNYTSFQLDGPKEEESDNKLILDWTDAFLPTYIPDGYGAVNVSYSDSIKKIIFTNESNEASIIYAEYNSSNSVAVDTENSSLIESVKINDYDGTLSIKDSNTTLVWKMNNHFFIIQGDINKNEIIKMAEGVIFKK